MPITNQPALPPIGNEYACDHGGQEFGAENSYGGGYHEIEMKLDAGKPCDSFVVSIDYADPCSDCTKRCRFKVVAGEDGEFDLAAAHACGCCSGILEITGGGNLWALKAQQEATVFSVSLIPDESGFIPASGQNIVTQAESLGSASNIRIGGAVVNDPTLPYFNRKHVLSPAGTATEVFSGVAMTGFNLTQSDYDSCCECPTIPRCKRFCVYKEGSVIVGMAAPVEPLTTGTDWLVFYEADPASDVNSFFYLLDPASTPPATAVALPNSYALKATPGDMRAAIYVKG